jgi:hypothetical protein
VLDSSLTAAIITGIKSAITLYQNNTAMRWTTASCATNDPLPHPHIPKEFGVQIHELIEQLHLG